MSGIRRRSARETVCYRAVRGTAEVPACLLLSPAVGKWSGSCPPRGLEARPHLAPFLSQGDSHMPFVQTVWDRLPQHPSRLGLGTGWAVGRGVGGPLLLSPHGPLAAAWPCPGEGPPSPGQIFASEPLGFPKAGVVSVRQDVSSQTSRPGFPIHRMRSHDDESRVFWRNFHGG